MLLQLKNILLPSLVCLFLQSQRAITSFFTPEQTTSKKGKSKRVKRIVNRLRNVGASDSAGKPQTVVGTERRSEKVKDRSMVLTAGGGWIQSRAAVADVKLSASSSESGDAFSDDDDKMLASLDLDSIISAASQSSESAPELQCESNVYTGPDNSNNIDECANSSKVSSRKGKPKNIQSKSKGRGRKR